MPKNRSGGFTLIETLVALVIFSVMAVGFTRYIADRTRQTAYLTDKTIAAIIASNTITQMQVSGQWPGEGRIPQSVTMAGKDWLVDTRILSTSQSDILRLDVTVSLPSMTPDDKTTPTLIMLTGFMGKSG